MNIASSRIATKSNNTQKRAKEIRSGVTSQKQGSAENLDLLPVIDQKNQESK